VIGNVDPPLKRHKEKTKSIAMQQNIFQERRRVLPEQSRKKRMKFSIGHLDTVYDSPMLMTIRLQFDVMMLAFARVNTVPDMTIVLATSVKNMVN
jgi:hypothetical protein